MNARKLTMLSLTAAVIGSAAILSGCKSAPAEKQIFIPKNYTKMMKANPNGPFNKGWGQLGKIKNYDKIKIDIIVAPVQLDQSGWQKTNIRNLASSKHKDMKDLAKYVATSFKKSFKSSKSFKLASKKGDKTLELEFAIVQAIPNKPILGAIGNITNLTPIGLLLTPVKVSIRSKTGAGGVVVMESILRDSDTGEIIAVFTDRETARTAWFNTKDFTAYGGIRQIVDIWTKNIVKVLDEVKAGKPVKGKKISKFELFN
ncbi:MAG: DUF3313 domain-containing protein [Victivallaceae bacterium]|nr:DUF3313 domain-containing protein [Victivallaceae bacterium]